MKLFIVVAEFIDLFKQSEAAKKHKTDVMADGDGGQGKETKLILVTLLANLREWLTPVL